MTNFGQRETEHHHNCIIGGSWHESLKTVEAIHDCGREWIGIVKTFPVPKKVGRGNEDLARWNGFGAALKGVNIAVGYKY